MNKIDSIRNITIFTDFGTSMDFNQNVVINNIPDQCIVRSISYAGPSTDPQGVYLIWSDLINDFIGSFAVSTNVANDGHSINLFPQSVINLQYKPINNNTTLRFVIYTIASGSRTAVPASGLVGDFSMCLDFIKYSK